MMVRVDAEEVEFAYFAAGKREHEALDQNLQNGRGTRGFLPSPHVVGALAELAVAKRLNLYWGNFSRFRGIDVGGLVEVRACNDEEHRLVVKPDDDNDMPFVLADLSKFPFINLVGWLLAREAKREEWKGVSKVTRKTVYFVPRAVPPLRPIEELLIELGPLSARAGAL